MKVGIVDRTRSNKLVCGGTLLSAYHVLTAESCERDLSDRSADYLVLVGEHGTTDSVPRLYAVSHTKKIWSYRIITLAEPITFSSVVAPICLPVSTSSLYEGEEVTVTGWARYSKPIHLEVNKTVVYIQATPYSPNSPRIASSGPPLLEIKKNVRPIHDDNSQPPE